MRPVLAWAAAAALAAALPGCSLFTTSEPPPAAPLSAPPASAPPPGVPASPRARPAPQPPLPPLLPQLSDAEERRLHDRATRALEEAERAAQGVRPDELEPSGRETLASIQSFLTQARQALAGRDYERANTLARKAETLAKDLRTSAR